MAALVLAPSILREPWTETGCWYSGRIPQGGEVFLLLRRQDDSQQSALQFSDGLACWLSHPDAANGLRQVLPWINHAAVVDGMIASLETLPGRREPILHLTQPNNTTSVPLRRVGRELGRATRSGWRLGSRGLTASSEASILALDEDYPAAATLNRLLCQEGDEPPEGSRVTLREIVEGVRFPSVGNAHRYSRHFLPLHLGERAASFLATYYDYTGGAHGNTTLIGFNLRLGVKGWEKVELDTLFLQGTDWRERLNSQVREGLVALQASSLTVETSESGQPEVLGTFAVTPGGLVFFFSPYEVASYAEGCFAVCVPFARLDGCLDTNGPLREFLPK